MLYHWHELNRISVSMTDEGPCEICFDSAAATTAARGGALVIDNAPHRMRAANDTRRDAMPERLKARGLGLIGHPHHYPEFTRSTMRRQWTKRIGALFSPVQVFLTLLRVVELVRADNRAASCSHTMVSNSSDHGHGSIGAQRQRLDVARGR